MEDKAGWGAVTERRETADESCVIFSEDWETRCSEASAARHSAGELIEGGLVR